MKIDILLEATGYNFYWAEKEYKYKDGTPITCPWEDIDYRIIMNGIRSKKRSTTVDSKLYIQYEIDQLEGDFGSNMEIDFPGYIEEELKDTSFGITMKELVKSNDILIGYCYDDPNDYKEPKTDLINLPLNEFGMKPSYIMGYTPHDNVGREEVQDFFKLFIRKHYIIEEPVHFSFKWINTPNDVEKQWLAHLEEIEEWEKNKKEGNKISIIYSIDFMIQMFGEEKLQFYIDRGMVHGEPIGNSMSQVLLTFKDGHTEILSDNDFELDHFTSPELPL